MLPGLVILESRPQRLLWQKRVSKVNNKSCSVTYQGVVELLDDWYFLDFKDGRLEMLFCTGWGELACSEVSRVIVGIGEGTLWSWSTESSGVRLGWFRWLGISGVFVAAAGGGLVAAGWWGVVSAGGGFGPRVCIQLTKYPKSKSSTFKFEISKFTQVQKFSRITCCVGRKSDSNYLFHNLPQFPLTSPHQFSLGLSCRRSLGQLAMPTTPVWHWVSNLRHSLTSFTDFTMTCSQEWNGQLVRSVYMILMVFISVLWAAGT